MIGLILSSRYLSSVKSALMNWFKYFGSLWEEFMSYLLWPYCIFYDIGNFASSRYFTPPNPWANQLINRNKHATEQTWDRLIHFLYKNRTEGVSMIPTQIASKGPISSKLSEVYRLQISIYRFIMEGMLLGGHLNSQR